jgi:hypothetical protein
LRLAVLENIKKRLGWDRDRVRHSEEEIEQQGAVEGSEAFLKLCHEAKGLVAKVIDIAQDDKIPNEERATPLREVIRELSRVEKQMKGMPQAEEPGLRKQQKRFMNGLGDYIYGCKAYADFFQTGNRWYLGYARSNESSGTKKMEKARQELTRLS